ncbi:hypothetical protein ACFL0T_02675 [Candidatus Omnitrophota bacterium]
MRARGIFTIVVVCVIMYAPCSCAEDSKEVKYVDSGTGVKIPAHMEIQKVGDANILVPKGAKLDKTHPNRVTVEDSGSYFARRVDDMEARLSAIETTVNRLEADLNNVKKRVGGVHKKTLASTEKGSS